MILKLKGKSSAIQFQDAEIPQQITFGGRQLMAVHQLIGGERIVDSMGPSDAPLSWSGILLTSSATGRARYLDTLRRTGEQCTLSWDEYLYTVVVSSFAGDFQRAYQIPYHIVCTVVADQTALVSKAPPVDMQSALAADMTRANQLQGCIGDATLAKLTSGLLSAVNAVTGLVKPIANGLNSVLSGGGAVSCVIQTVNAAISSVEGAVAQIAAVQAHIQSLIASAESTVTSVTTLGGFAPGNPVAQMAQKVIGQVNSANQLPALYEYSSILGRAHNNLITLAAQGPTAKTITVGGGSLYQVAAQQYGDASQWNLIAQANGLSDPQIVGTKTLIIPPLP